jgi:hypothetical protein
MKKLIGRRDEAKILMDALVSSEAELISVIGRRRVGKTFLVRMAYEGKIDYELLGIQKGTRNSQLKNFTDQLEIFTKSELPLKKPADWQEAFKMLRNYLISKLESKKEKLVIFLDEVPWLAGQKSGFLEAFGYFWNSWASQQNIVVVICGSSASWMVRKVLRDKGGLHNRVTKRMRLQPFTLPETEEYLQHQGILLDRYHILLIYMAIGGIPHYLKEIVGHRSAIQNINYICFSEGGLLRDEFASLYPALFEHSDYHLAIIRVLADRHYGMMRKEIVESLPYNDSGRITQVLEELMESGFVSESTAFDKKKKEKIFRLSDEYSLFYLRFVEKNKSEEEDVWNKLSQTQAFKTWSGYAFENICLKHLPQIKNALGISGMYSSASSFVKIGKGEEKGMQVDLLIDRNDHVINLIEIKFYNTAISLDKSDADALREKLSVFQDRTGTKKMVNWVVLSTFGLKPNVHSQGIITKSIDMNALFG